MQLPQKHVQDDPVSEGIIHLVVNVSTLDDPVSEGIIHLVVNVSTLDDPVSEGIIHLVVNVSTLTLFIRHIYYRNFQFLNEVSIAQLRFLP
jgi:hypothetical protein